LVPQDSTQDGAGRQALESINDGKGLPGKVLNRSEGV